MDFRINYYFMQGGKVFVSLTRKGRDYIRECKLDGSSRPSFKFRMSVWFPDVRLTMQY